MNTSKSANKFGINVNGETVRYSSIRPLLKRPGRSGELAIEDVVSQFRIVFAIIRSRWLIGFCAAILVAGALGFLLFRSKPEHTAVTTLLAQSPLDEILDANPSMRSGKVNQDNVLYNHLSVLKSRRFSTLLAKEFSAEERAVVEAPYRRLGEEYSDWQFEMLIAGHLSVEREREREFFTLSFHHREPSVAVMVVNEMTSTYLKLVQNEVKQAHSSAVQMLNVQIEQLQSEISELERQQRDYRKKHNLISMQENQGLLAERLRKVEQNRATARYERMLLETELSDAERDIAASDMPFENHLLANYANNQQLRQDLDRLNAELDTLLLRYGSKHPKILNLNAVREGIHESISNNFELALGNLKNEYSRAQSIEDQLEKQLDEGFAESIEIGRLAEFFLRLGSEVDVKRESLGGLLRRVVSADLLSRLPTDVMRVVDPGYLVEPQLPKWVMHSTLIVFFAGSAFLVLPLGLHFFDDRIKSATEVEEELGQILMGAIPRLSRLRPEERPHIVRDWLNYPAKVEAFMTIVAQIELISAQVGSKCFVVTSSAQGEGKSMMASNLGAGFSRVGRRTLIVDCDLRRPCQHRIHRIEVKGGLIPWANAGYPMEDVFAKGSQIGIQTLSDGTDLLPSGGLDREPSHILASANIEELFALLMKRYDIIIIDTPPAGLFSDALVLARIPSETVLVVRESTAAVSHVRNVISSINKTSSPVMGVLLNDYSSNGLNMRLSYSYEYGEYGNGRSERRMTKSTDDRKALVSRAMRSMNR